MPSKKGQSRERKDAAKFDLAEPTGEIIYPPYQPTSEDFKAQLKRYNVYPEPDQIHRYPRHIPYSSDKKRFFAKTGRESFEGVLRMSTLCGGERGLTIAAFQYKFHYTEPPADDGRRSHAGEKEWPVLWDYNTGLVRITPFFKCQNYGKVRIFLHSCHLPLPPPPLFSLLLLLLMSLLLLLTLTVNFLLTT